MIRDFSSQSLQVSPCLCINKSLSFSSDTSSSSSSTPPVPPNDSATLIQGPSLLVNTAVHRPSPSLFFLPGLRSLPFWTPPSNKSNSSSKRTSPIAYNDPTLIQIVSHLETNASAIKKEYMDTVMGMGNSIDPRSPSGISKPLEPDYDVNASGGEHASESLHVGTWDWHSYLLNGKAQTRFEKRCPITTQVIQNIKEHLFDENPFGFCFFSTLQGKSFIKPHSGPMNLRLRIHLPLIVPSDCKPDAYSTKPMTKCGIRVGNQIREWEEGKAVVLDDSYQHEVWNETDSLRVLLLVDIWHPDISMEERTRIRNMFQFAHEQGWLGGTSS